MFEDVEPEGSTAPESTAPNSTILSYAYGHLLNPVYRGMLLSDVNLKDSTLEQFVADNEKADTEHIIPDNLIEAVVNMESYIKEDFLIPTLL